MELDIDNHKLMYHPERVAKWKEKGDCFPIYVEIEPISFCNHKCTFCGLDWARKGMSIDSKLMYNTLDNLADCGVKSICFAGAGEPMLHKDIVGFIKKCASLNIDSSLSTNAALFKKEESEKCLPYLSWIRFSVDAANPKTHALLHGTSELDFEKVKKNIEDAVKIKKRNNYKVNLGAQFLLLDENRDEVIDFIRLFKKMGVDNVQIKPYSQNPNSINQRDISYKKFEYLEEELKEFSDKNFSVIYRVNRIKQLSQGQEYSECYGLPFFTIITSEANVMPCHLHLGNDSYSYGNLNSQSFKETWEGKKRKKIIEQIKSDGISHCKKGCRLDIINRYLYRLKNPECDDNFI